MRKVTRIKTLVVLLVVLFAIVSCANFISNSYKTLALSKDVYDKAMLSVADLQKQGLISADKRAEINKVAKIYKDAHNVAESALEVYYLSQQQAADKDKLLTALTELANKWADVAKLINDIKPGVVPAKLQ